MLKVCTEKLSLAIAKKCYSLEQLASVSGVSSKTIIRL